MIRLYCPGYSWQSTYVITESVATFEASGAAGPEDANQEKIIRTLLHFRADDPRKRQQMTVVGRSGKNFQHVENSATIQKMLQEVTEPAYVCRL